MPSELAGHVIYIYSIYRIHRNNTSVINTDNQYELFIIRTNKLSFIIC